MWGRVVGVAVARFSAAEVERVARLARLRLDAAERERAAGELGAITDAFSDLAGFAATLPPAPEDAAAGVRDDEAEVVPVETADAILAAAPRVDAASRSVRGPRGAP